MRILNSPMLPYAPMLAAHAMWLCRDLRQLRGGETRRHLMRLAVRLVNLQQALHASATLAFHLLACSDFILPGTFLQMWRHCGVRTTALHAIHTIVTMSISWRGAEQSPRQREAEICLPRLFVLYVGVIRLCYPGASQLTTGCRDLCHSTFF